MIKYSNEELQKYLIDEIGYIKNHLGTFEDFHDLLDFRRQIREHRPDTHRNYLGTFWILNGRYHIDEFAQIGKVCGGMDKLAKYFDIPLVMTEEKLRDFMDMYNRRINALTHREMDLPWEEREKIIKETGRPWPFDGVAYSFNASLPRRNTVCPYCGKGWDINNVDDCLHHESEWKEYPSRQLDLYGDVLWDFVGQPIGNMWDFFVNRSNAIYYPMREGGVSNPKWVDTRIDPKYKTLQINPHGFYNGTYGKIDENYIIQENDSVHFQVKECYHKECNRKKLNETETEKFKECFEKAGYTDFEMFPIPNEYCHDIENCTICANWFLVNTKWGNIKIGWRKRVINIDWSDFKKKPNGHKLFDDEKVTVDDSSVHAWGWEKCVEYLEKLRKYLY